MPTTYTHYRFGKDVYKQLPTNMKKRIDQAPQLYYIGVHGPDILFYYHPLSKNDVIKRGNAMHEESAFPFFEQCKKIINRNPRGHGAYAYVMGFVTHFMLDSECHPFVNEWIGQSGAGHLEIEMELDRMLLLRDHHHPLEYPVTQHIHATRENAMQITRFWEGISGKEIQKTLSLMKTYCELLHCKKAKRTIIDILLKVTGNYEKLHGLFMSFRPNQNCKKSNEQLLKLYHDAVQKTVDIMVAYDNNLDMKQPLNARFDKNYSGVRIERVHAEKVDVECGSVEGNRSEGAKNHEV